MPWLGIHKLDNFLVLVPRIRNLGRNVPFHKTCNHIQGSITLENEILRSHNLLGAIQPGESKLCKSVVRCEA